MGSAADSMVTPPPPTPLTPSASDLVTLAINFPKRAPTPEDKCFKTVEGRPVAFDAYAMLDRVAHAYCRLSDRNRALLQTLPWFPPWIKGKSNELADKRRVRQISKSCKVQMLQVFYPVAQPGWRDEIPMLLEDNQVWVFRPTHFLDDISCAWLDGKPVLSEDDKAALETLPWLKPWIHNIEKKRLQRKRPRCDARPHMHALSVVV